MLGDGYNQVAEEVKVILEVYGRIEDPLAFFPLSS
jgi:hypothetical protein